MCDRKGAFGCKGKQQGPSSFCTVRQRSVKFDLTIDEVLDDPLIKLMLDADGISRNAFAHFLESAARRQARLKDISSSIKRTSGAE